tara:strand:- start:450 stop:1037 length:588 start_codon:yes stop_codon:yes gene_type:complete
MNNEIIKNSLNKYDSNKIFMEKKLKNVRYYKFVYKNLDFEKNIIQFYDKDKNFLYEYYYEIIGQYNNINKLWQWAWSNTAFNKNINYTSRKLLNYGLDIEFDSYSVTISSILNIKKHLITSHFIVDNIMLLDIYLGLANYLVKNINIIYIKNYVTDIKKIDSVSFHDFHQNNQIIDNEHDENFILSYIILFEKND